MPKYILNTYTAKYFDRNCKNFFKVEHLMPISMSIRYSMKHLEMHKNLIISPSTFFTIPLLEARPGHHHLSPCVSLLNETLDSGIHTKFIFFKILCFFSDLRFYTYYFLWYRNVSILVSLGCYNKIPQTECL